MSGWNSNRTLLSSLNLLLTFLHAISFNHAMIIFKFLLNFIIQSPPPFLFFFFCGLWVLIQTELVLLHI